MYRVTGTWAGNYLYDFNNLQNEIEIDGAIEKIIKSFHEKEYSLPKSMEGSKAVPDVICITVLDTRLPWGAQIVRVRDVKL